MQLYLDQDSNSFITDPLFKSPLPELNFKRGDSATINLALVTGNTALSAVSGKEIKFAIKVAGDYDGSPLVYADTYTIAGNNYVLNPSFNTTALNSYLSGDLASIGGMLEIQITQSGIIASSNTQGVTIYNDVIRNGELTPTVLPTPLEWLDANLIALSSSPYTAYATFATGATLGPVPLFDAGGSVYTSDGNASPAVAGDWFSLSYDGFDFGWFLNYYEDGSQPAQDSSWFNAGPITFPSGGTYTAVNNNLSAYQYVNVAVTTQDTKNTHRFLANNNNFYVNIGNLTGTQNWRVVTTTPIATP